MVADQVAEVQADRVALTKEMVLEAMAAAKRKRALCPGLRS